MLASRPVILCSRELQSVGSNRDNRVNSGHIPTSTWLHEPHQGGGMMVGEMCHFIDLMYFICEERPLSVFARSLSLNNQKIADSDNLVVMVSFDGGSVGTLCYNTVGSKAFSKERLEVFGGGRAAVLDDFRALEITEGEKVNRAKSSTQDKGQKNEVAETVKAFRTNGSAPIQFQELVNVMRIIFAARESVLRGEPVQLAGS